MLGDPLDEAGEPLDPWQFDEGRWLDLKGGLRIPLAHPGRALDFSCTTLGMPVVHGRLVPVFQQLGLREEVQLLEAQVEGMDEPYFILNALRVIRCIDDARSERVEYWKPEDARPDKEGQYRVVSGMRIEPLKVEGAQVFRPWGWRVALLVSERLKQALEEMGTSGTTFVRV